MNCRNMKYNHKENINLPIVVHSVGGVGQKIIICFSEQENAYTQYGINTSLKVNRPI